MARRRSFLRWPTWKKDGYMSEIAVMRASRPTNWKTVWQYNVNIFKVTKSTEGYLIFTYFWWTCMLHDRFGRKQGVVLKAGQDTHPARKELSTYVTGVSYNVTWCSNLSTTGHTHRIIDSVQGRLVLVAIKTPFAVVIADWVYIIWCAILKKLKFSSWSATPVDFETFLWNYLYSSLKLVTKMGINNPLKSVSWPGCQVPAGWS